MNVFLRSYRIALWFLFTVPSFLPAQPIAFTRVSPGEGVNWGFITGITQDRQGFMWFTGQLGLFRYDGYQFNSYQHDPKKPGSLANGPPECVYADHQGIVWVGTLGVGLDRLDPATGLFTHFRHQSNNRASLSGDTVTAILEDHAGMLWIGTHRGLNRLDRRTGKFTRYRQDPKDTNSLSNDQVRALYEDRQGTIWVGTGSAFVNENKTKEGGLNRFDRKTGKFIRYRHHPQDPQSLADNRVRAIFEDSRGTFWVGTAGNGLHKMDRAKGTFQRYVYDSKHPQKLSRPAQKTISYADDHITFITEDAVGSLWIGTFLAGLTRYDPKTQQVVRYEAGKDKVESFQENMPWGAYTSRDGVLWISTFEGNLYRTYPFPMAIPHYALPYNTLPHNELASHGHAFHQEASGVQWIGTHQELIRIDSSQGSIRHFVHDSLNPASLSSSDVRSIYEDRQGTLWIGTDGGGLNRFDRKSQTFTHYRHQPGQVGSLSTDTSLYAILEDRKGSLWVGTYNGLNRMDSRTGRFTPYRHHPKDTTSLSRGSISSLVEDRQGNLWVGAWDESSLGGGGLDRLDHQTGRFEHFLSKESTFCLYEDADGQIWAGTERGLYRLDRAAHRFAAVTEPFLERKIPNVYGIIEDQEKNLWLAVKSVGFIQLNRKRDQARFYGKSYGIDGSKLLPFASYRDRQDQLFFFGDETGYYAFNPEALDRNTIPPQIVLTDFRLSDQSVKPGQGSPLKGSLEQLQEIPLRYDQNFFSFGFTGLHYSHPEQNRYDYRLDNYDRSWRVANSERTASYYQVPPGRYSFRLRVASSEGTWSEKAVAIIISPPWWGTWWAYACYALAFSGSLGGFVYWRSRSLVREKRVLEQRVAQRTAEVVTQKEEIATQRDNLESALKELQATQSQLVQKEKMASLGELTAGIAHEIQNPLNFVNNFSEVSRELVEELQEEWKKGDGRTEAEKEILEDLDQNLEKIHHHGQRADSIVKGMLQHSRSTTGEKQLTDLNALADEYLRLSYHGLRAKDKDFNATLTTDFDLQLGKVAVVPQEIGRVLLNLFNNAFYATQEKKTRVNGQYQPEVKVSTRRVGNQVEIRIWDNGTGIPAKVVDKIFQPFFTTKPAGQGTGLGLSLSYDIITKSQGGTLTVETHEGEFAGFLITLPIIR